MPWMINKARIDLMIRAAAQQGWENVNDWWRDESLITRAWALSEYPKELGAGAGAFDAGDCVAIITNYPPAVLNDETKDFVGWTLCALAPHGAPTWIPRDALYGPARQKLPAGWVTQWSADKQLNLPRTPCAPGNLLACRMETGEGQLGICTATDTEGRALLVQTELNGPEEDARLYSRRWFPLAERDEGFYHLFGKGRTRFSHYMPMIKALADAQKKSGKSPVKKNKAGEVVPNGHDAKRAPSPEPIQPPANPAVEAFAEAYSTGLLCPVGVGADRNPFNGRDPIKAAGWLAGWEHSAANSG